MMRLGGSARPRGRPLARLVCARRRGRSPHEAAAANASPWRASARRHGRRGAGAGCLDSYQRRARVERGSCHACGPESGSRSRDREAPSSKGSRIGCAKDRDDAWQKRCAASTAVKRLRITMSACDVAILTSRITGIARDVAFLTMRITGSAHDVAIVPMCFRDAHGQKDRLSGSTPARGDRLP
jgi:hypothetical protein